MNKKASISIVVVIIIAFLYDCRKDKYVVPVCYDTDVQPILTNKCSMSGCHNSTDKAGGLDLSSYTAVQNYPNKSRIYDYIKKGLMPKNGYLSVQEKEIIARWAGQNYTRGDCNATQNSSACDTTNVTYTNTLKTIFDNNCIGCHNASNPSGGYALDTYMGCKMCAQSGRLIGAVKWLPGYSPMPLGGNKLSDCTIAKIQKWINAGMPN
ncbi:MAG: hypothetical protein KatS3mg028_0340 [Bacteroidia bacterium]|nr:MAG: hypothetical protein KatS3mg028_0340 [Bacteroidia bacterium]